MATCAHTQWLGLAHDDNGARIQYHGRLLQLAAGLPRPSEQFPSVIHFIGKQRKTAVLRVLMPDISVSNFRRQGLVDISIDHNTAEDDHPLLVADSCPQQLTTNFKETLDSCHDVTSFDLRWPDEAYSPDREDLIQFVHARLLFLFVDLICIFAQDVGGLDGVAKMLIDWAQKGSASTLSQSVRPRILIVTEVTGSCFPAAALRFRLEVESNLAFYESFSSIQVINVLEKRRSRRPRSDSFSALKQVLRAEVHTAQEARISSNTRFSMDHLASFFNRAVYQFANFPKLPFDFIAASRQYHPVLAEHSRRLGSIVERIMVDMPVQDICKFVGSTILLDGYPPDMHMFDPCEVFRNLYKEKCVSVLKSVAVAHGASMATVCTQIQAEMIILFAQMRYEGQTAAELHWKSIQRYGKHLAVLQTRYDCLFCSIREPEHVMECGHAICDVCVRIFGRPTSGVEYHFDIATCPAHQETVHFQAKLLPPTCGVRFVAIDGGGSRGGVAIKFIAKLGQALDLPYPIQEHFDFAIGTSSGGLVTLALFAKHWTPKQCLTFFHKFARRIFPSRLGMRDSIYRTVRRCFSSLLGGGKYKAISLEETLQEAFGQRALFGSVAERPSGMKFAITATTISDATLCLMSNYNGMGENTQDSRYKHLRATDAADEVLLWEAARCTTAAPTYFEPKFLRSFGTFQDGGLKYNNPVRPGLREVRRVWADGACDMVLSIGTGYQKKLASPMSSNVRNFLQDGALARLYRASMHSLSLNGQNSWDDHWHGLEENKKNQHFRLNLPLTKEPELDDVDQMQYLEDQVQYHLGDIEGIARALKALSFFFELDAPLVKQSGVYVCSGSILARSPDSGALVHGLRAVYPYAQFTYQGTAIGFLSQDDVCKICGRFQKRVEFSVRHPSDSVDILLLFNRLFRRSISGFPNSMDWFTQRQGMDAAFGRKDHSRKIGQGSQTKCPCHLQRYQALGQLVDTKRNATDSVARPRKRQRLA